jgi:hypothetical protein
MLGVGLLAILLSACGGGGGERELKMPVRVSLGPYPDLDAIKQMVRTNSQPIMTLTARCDAVLANVDMRPRGQLKMDGQLSLMKSGRVRIDLRRAGELAVGVIGDGQRYQTRMPMLGGGLQYSGRYGAPLEKKAGRIHFVADDVADTLDMTTLFDGTVQALRTYPPLLDVHSPASSSARKLHSAVYVDSLRVVSAPAPALKILSSLAVDWRTGRVLALDKFRFDGSLRTRIWILNWRTVTGPDIGKDIPAGTRVTVDVPSDFVIYYPPPLEGTSVRIQLSDIRLNAFVDEESFVVGR